MTNLMPPQTNNKYLLRRMNEKLKIAIKFANGATEMELNAGCLNKAELAVVKEYLLKRGWEVTRYKWTEAYERHYTGYGAMKVKWVG